AVEVRRVAEHDLEYRLRESILGAAHDLQREGAGKFDERFGGPLHRPHMRRRRRLRKPWAAYSRYMYSRVAGCGKRPSGSGLPTSSWKIDSQPRSNAC